VHPTVCWLQFFIASIPAEPSFSAEAQPYPFDPTARAPQAFLNHTRTLQSLANLRQFASASFSALGREGWSFDQPWALLRGE
jgi:hypothetical protein